MIQNVLPQCKSYIYDRTDIAGAQFGHHQAVQTLIGKTLILKSDCSTCQKDSAASIGPAFDQIAARYKTDPKAIDYLASKVDSGSHGIWGKVPMPAHANMKDAEVKKITEWIMTLGHKDASVASLPAAGEITPRPTSVNKSVLTA
ncbi:MAG: c-type cytochrome [Pedobacter agri]